MITLVTPWYGAETRGGAESQTRGLALALRDIGVSVRVWASTGRDSFDEAAPGLPPGTRPHYPPGHSELEGIPIWRFRPAATGTDGVPRFFRERPALLPPLERFGSHELHLLANLLSSDELYAAIMAEREHSRFVFVIYPFPTTFWGALVAPEVSYLLPCLHDEPYAYYSTYHYLFSRVRGALFNSHPEAELARRLYGLPEERLCVAGEGVNLTPPRGDGERFRRWLADHLPSTIQHPPSTLLYLGRRDEGKNLPLLLAYMREYRARRGADVRLLMAGQGAARLPFTPYAYGTGAPTEDSFVLDPGFLDEQTKYDACAACDLFVQPSLIESFSIVLMEAWLQGAAALVHAGCAVTADHARRSGGALAFDSFGSFAAALDLLLPRPDLRRILGARGRAYVLETCDWHTVARRTADFVLQDR